MKKLKILCLVLAMLLAASCLAACGGEPEPAPAPAEPAAPAEPEPAAQSDLQYIKDKGTLVIGITDYQPINYYDESGELIGFDTELATAVCAKLGVEPVFEIIDWGAKETELAAFRIDAIWNGMTYTDEREENMNFAKNYLYNNIVLVVDNSKAGEYTSIEALAGKSVVSETGSSGEECVQSQMPDSEYTAVANLVTALMEVAAGTADAAAVDSIMAYDLVGKGAYENLHIVDGVILAQEELGAAFRTGSDVVAAVNTAMDELVSDGTYACIGEKYNLSDILILGK